MEEASQIQLADLPAVRLQAGPQRAPPVGRGMRQGLRPPPPPRESQAPDGEARGRRVVRRLRHGEGGAEEEDEEAALQDTNREGEGRRHGPAEVRDLRRQNVRRVSGVPEKVRGEDQTNPATPLKETRGLEAQTRAPQEAVQAPPSRQAPEGGLPEQAGPPDLQGERRPHTGEAEC